MGEAAHRVTPPRPRPLFCLGPWLSPALLAVQESARWRCSPSPPSSCRPIFPANILSLCLSFLSFSPLLSSVPAPLTLAEVTPTGAFAEASLAASPHSRDILPSSLPPSCRAGVAEAAAEQQQQEEVQEREEGGRRRRGGGGGLGPSCPSWPFPRWGLRPGETAAGAAAAAATMAAALVS